MQGSFKVLASPANATAAVISAAKTAAIQDAKAKALQAAGFSSATDKNGMDGKIESDVNNVQRKTTLNWLNAYNAPHWMQFFASAGNGYATTNDKLGAAEWTNLQTGGTKSNVFGTSWLLDLMNAATTAMTAETGAEALRFDGAGDLGMTLNLGISPQYISANNQNKVNGKDVILGLLKPAANSTVPAGITGAGVSAFTQNQWNYNNAVVLSGLLVGTNQYSANKPDSNDIGLNDQKNALRDLLTFFTATRK
ncbi:hypothetical protein LP416_08000 [Polaromonas sp. P2-4]|nr:hypothetical protein LP416_08000 [Polaromonas sp. P2-4]